MALVQVTHGIGNLFWHTIRLQKRTEIYHAFPTHEIDAPYRWANSHIFRLPLTTFGIAVGRWHSATRTEEQAILAGISGREVEKSEHMEIQKAREAVARNTDSLDDEWTIVNSLDLM